MTLSAAVMGVCLKQVPGEFAEARMVQQALQYTISITVVCGISNTTGVDYIDGTDLSCYPTEA